MKIERIFLCAILALSTLCLGGCATQNPKPILLPDDVKAITQPYIEAIKTGNLAKAEKLMASGAVDDLREQFDADHNNLENGPELKPMVIRYRATVFGQPDKNDVVVIYSGKKDKLWTSVQMRLFRLEGERYEIEYAVMGNQPEMPAELIEGQAFKNGLLIVMAALAFMALLFVGALIWFVKRKSHIIAPEQTVDSRPIASTQQDSSYSGDI